MGRSLGHDGVRCPHGRLGGGRTDLGCGHCVNDSLLDAYLKHEHGALQSVATDGRTSQSTVHTAWAEGSRAALPVPKAPAVHLHATVSPDTGLRDGQAVTVRWSGYTAGKVVNILECSTVEISTASSAGCSFAHSAILHPDPTGSGSRCPPHRHGHHRQRCVRRGTQLLRRGERRQFDQSG